jgi:acetyl-CoA synthetase
LPDSLKGNIIHASVILATGYAGSDQLEAELKEHVQKEIGPIARPEFVVFEDSLPKTRSGKIMRRVLKARALGQDEGDITTLEE